jgi:hypothetical protein
MRRHTVSHTHTHTPIYINDFLDDEGPIYLYCTYLYCTHYSAYIKAVPCTILIAEYIIHSYFAHFQSLFSLSPSYSQHGIRATFLWPSLGKIRRSSAATGSRSLPRDRKPSRRFCLPRNPHLRVVCSTHGHLHWIDLIKICPLPPKSAGSGPHAPSRAARSFWLSSHVRTRSHAQPRRHAPHALVLPLPCHVSPSDVSDVSIVTASVDCRIDR